MPTQALTHRHVVFNEASEAAPFPIHAVMRAVLAKYACVKLQNRPEPSSADLAYVWCDRTIQAHQAVKSWFQCETRELHFL
jgi:hypothetical protein